MMNSKKIINSTKYKKFIKFIFEIPYYIGDISVIIVSLIKNLLTINKAFDKDIVIVTGSDSMFAETLFQLLANLESKKFHESLIVYDLGMNNEQIQYIKSEHPSVTIEEFKFESYPDFISKRDTHGTLGAYAWKPNIVYETLKKYKKKVIWLDSANLINWRFIFVLIVLTNKKFFSPISAGNISDYTFKDTIEEIDYPRNKLNKRNLTGGFNGFDWNDENSRKIAEMWRDLSNKEELILPKKSTKFNHRWDQSILTLLIYKYNFFGYLPKIKKIFGIKVNQNPRQDFFLLNSEENLFTSELYFEWYKNFKNISTKTIKYSKIIWMLDSKCILKIPKKYLKSRKVICNIFNTEDVLFLLENTSNKYIDAYFIYDKNIKHNLQKQIIYLEENTSIKKYSEILMNLNTKKLTD